MTGRTAGIPGGNVQPVIPVAHQVTPLHTDFELEPKNLDELRSLPPAELAKVDIARMNLLCASGLQGARNLNAQGIDHALTALDQWAERVRDETDRYFYKFLQNPVEYENSEAYFRMLTLITVLQQDLGVHYNLARVRDVDFTDARDLFIHGMIPPAPGSSASISNGGGGPTSGGGGTCVSMPVLYTAIARRLGYPVKLVTTAAHVFCRWDGLDHPNPGFRGRFNCEATNQGLDTPSDDYYRNWPRSITEAEIRANRYLESMTADRELALFFATRGHNLFDTGRVPEARQAYGYAVLYARDTQLYRGFFTQTNQVLARGRAVHPGEAIYDRAGGGFGNMIYNMDPMAEIRAIQELNARNTRYMKPVQVYGPPNHSGQVQQQ